MDELSRLIRRININIDIIIIDSPFPYKTPYLKIKGSAPVSCQGREGRLVWNCGLWHDITFEDYETNKKYYVENLMSEEEAEKLFNNLVEKYGT